MATKPLYLCRQASGYYEFGLDSTDWSANIGFSYAAFLKRACAKELHRITAIRLKPGAKPIRVKLTRVRG